MTSPITTAGLLSLLLSPPLFSACSRLLNCDSRVSMAGIMA